MRVHKWVAEGKYRCNDCDLNLTSNRNYKHHMLLYHGIRVESPSDAKPHKCDYPNCNKAYTTPRILTVHKKSHEELYICRYCGKELRLRNSYIKHEKHCKKRPS
ncbi:uncharacterized protein [Bemisia tabaci]|uniref:uncharacterized protein n=1 Tax=Bemisia tabaci TaxID=7038 RepID=UPI003B28B31D